MKFLYRSSPPWQPRKSKGKLTQIGAVAGLMVLCHAALHIIASVSFLLLQLFLDFCQTCVTILKIRGV